MISAYVVSTAPPGSLAVSGDLAAAGFRLVGQGAPETMVEDVIRSTPDVLVCFEDHPDAVLFAGAEALDTSSPRPTVMFTNDPDAEKIERAARAGIHAYVVNGYGGHRLRAVVHVAQARFRHVQALRDSLADVNNRFAERKLVDRAKGIFMRLRALSEDEAYAVLRSAAMGSKRRIGQVAQQIIDAARYGEAVNRAGQLRMTSQRLVNLYAQLCGGASPGARELLDRTVAQADGNLAALGRILSKPTFGDLLDAVAEAWKEVKASLAAPPDRSRLRAVDAVAERLLLQAEQLTGNLEHAGFVAALRLINVSGRQRMLCQRLAKQAALASLLPAAEAPAAADRATTAEAFTQAMAFLDAVPLSTPEIDGHLRTARATWADLQAVLATAGGAPALAQVFALGEALLATFDALTAEYERNLQILLA